MTTEQIEAIRKALHESGDTFLVVLESRLADSQIERLAAAFRASR